jgi:hypothetical protein
MGAGVFNLKTAMANSIDADTAMRFNDYVARATRESARLHAERVDQRLARNRSLYDARQRQLRDNPTQRDVESGDALNAAVADLSDPRLGSSALRAAKVPVPAGLIADVPFINAAERVTLMLTDERSTLNWSEVFDEERFGDDRKTFDDLLERIKSQAFDGDLPPQILREARGFIDGLRTKLQAQPLRDPAHQKEAMRFITACTDLLGLMDKPNIRPALLELRKIQDTMLCNLLGFMNAYNLRFGPASTPRERQVYAQLFAILDQTRDQLLAEAKPESKTAPQGNPIDATNFFQNLEKALSQSGAPGQPPQRRNQ